MATQLTFSVQLRKCCLAAGVVIWLISASNASWAEPKVEKLRPSIRVVEQYGQSKQSLKNFERSRVAQARIVDLEAVKKLPRILAFDGEKVIASEGSLVFVRGISPHSKATSYDVIGALEPVKNPESGQVVGQLASVKGKVELVKAGETASFRVSLAQKELEVGDRLIANQPPPLKYRDASPAGVIQSQVLAIFGGPNEAGKGQLVVIEGGKDQQLEVGNLLSVFRQRRAVQDPLATEWFPDDIKVDNSKTAELLLVEVKEAISLALVTKVGLGVRVTDKVANAK